MKQEVESLVVLAVAGLMACGCAARAQQGARSWHELQTKSFVLVTDVRMADARERARELEELGAALSEVYPARSNRPDQPARLRVIHFARCRELHDIYTGRADSKNSRTAVQGLVTASLEFGTARLIATCESDPFRPEVVVNILAHELNHRYFSSMPAWLRVGLAAYYQTIALRDGKVVVGSPPPLDGQLWRRPGELPSLREVLAMDGHQLARLSDGRGYFAAWKLTHFLASSNADYRRRFWKMLEGLATGQDKDASFAAAYGDLGGRLDQEYADYLGRQALRVWERPYRKPTFYGVGEERRLRPGEVEALQVDLRSFRAAPTELLGRLSRLEDGDPSWAGRFYWRALVALRVEGERDQAIGLLRQYVAHQPDDAQAWLALVHALYEQHRPWGDGGVEAQAVPGLETIEQEVRELGRVAATPGQLNAVAWYYAQRHQPGPGLRYIRRAVAAQPGCATCWETVGLLYFHAGRPDEALRAQERAIALMGGAPLARATRQRLEHYRRAALSVSSHGEPATAEP